MGKNIPLLPFPDLPNTKSYQYSIRQANSLDIPALTALHFTAFGSDLDQFIPNNSDGRAWMSEAFRVCFEEFDKDCLTLLVAAKLIENNGADTVGEWETIAYARYIVPTKEVWDNMYSYPKAIGEMDQTRIDEFLGGLESQHANIMGWTAQETGLKHLWLENLATHPDHRRLGIGRKLVEYACNLADEMGLETYLDASDFGMGLYERFGFELVKGVGNRAVSAPMVRSLRN